MRFMVMVKGSDDPAKKGAQPTDEEFAEMGKFNEELVKAGVMLAGEGLVNTTDGAIIRYSGEAEARVIDGPFAESKELVAGFWMLQVKDKAEVIEWMKRAPFREGEIEIRRVAEVEDFENISPEVVEAEKKLRDQLDTK